MCALTDPSNEFQSGDFDQLRVAYNLYTLANGNVFRYKCFHKYMYSLASLIFKAMLI